MLYFLYGENHSLFSNDLGVKYALEIHASVHRRSYGVVFLLTQFLYVLQFQCLCISALFSSPNELLFIFISQNNAFVKKKKLEIIQTHSMKYAIMSLVSNSPVLDVFSN